MLELLPFWKSPLSSRRKLNSHVMIATVSDELEVEEHGMGQSLKNVWVESLSALSSPAGSV